MHCENFGITPSDIFTCIKDLFDFHSNTNFNINTSPTLLEKDNHESDKKPTSKITRSDSFQSEKKEVVEYVSNIDNNYNTNTNTGTNAIAKLKDDSLQQTKIPFVSQISNYIAQKKKEYDKISCVIATKHLYDHEFIINLFSLCVYTIVIQKTTAFQIIHWTNITRI